MRLKFTPVAFAVCSALPFAAQAAPKVSFVAPLDGGSLSGDVRQESRCEVRGSSDIRRVVFWLDGNIQLNTEGNQPWNCNVDTRQYFDGAHKLKAVAYDSRGASTATEISVNFANGNAAPSTGGGTGGGSTTYSGTPFSGTPIALPKAFAAADFDRGGQNVAYKDASSGNQGGQYRTGEDVDIAGTRDSEGVSPHDIINFQTGEWLAYTVNVPATGKYDIAVRASNNYSSPTAFHVEVDGVNVTGSVSVPKTGSWSSYQWAGKQGVDLTAGKRVIKVVADAEYFGLNGISVLASGSTGGGSTPPASGYAGTPYSGTPIALPNAFAAADFDRGGQNVAYKDASSGNQGGQYRTGEDVDIAATRDSQGVSPHDIINFQTGEWLAYTVNVPAAGKYDIAVRAANNYSSPTAFHVELNGADVTGSVAVPKTGSWSTYQWVGKQGIDLPAGKQVIKVVADAEYFGLNGIRVLASGSTGGGGTPAPGISVAFDAPQSGATISTALNQESGCQVSGSGFTKVDFFLDSTPLNSEGSAPWQCNLDPALFPIGSHKLIAKAYDANGGSASAEVAINTTTGSTGGTGGGGTGPVGEKPAGMLFWSGFDGNITPGTPYDCYSNGCYQDLTGTDSITGFAFPPKINGGSTRFQMISNANSSPTPSTLDNWMHNEIQTVTGRTGAQTRALYSHISQSGCCGTSPQGGGSTQDTLIMFPSTDVNEFYYSAWIKLQDDLTSKMLAGDPWRSFFAIKTTDTDWRLEMYAVDWAKTGRPQLMVMTDQYAPTRKEFWRVYGDPVPIGRWFKYEVYVKRSSGSDGRVWVAVDGKVLADKWGPNYGGNRSRINRIMSTLLYSGGAYPIYQWVDDMQLWTTFPNAKAGDPWYDGVYAPH